jgi:hypothetical protein
MFICIPLMGCFLAGCDEEVKKDALEKYIYVNKSSLNMFYGDRTQLKANPVGESFEWTSADPAIATVTAEGLVEAVGVGSTEITVSQGSSQTSLPVTVTVPTADRVIVAGENGRFQIAVQTLSERIASVRIIWNNERDSTDIPVDNQAGIFIRSVDYSGESGYVFRIVSFDSFGNRSVSSETTAMLIRNRDLSAKAMDDGSLTIQWGNNIQYVDHCILSYTNQSGQTVSRKVFPSETTTEISGYSSDLSLATLFLIPPIADTFRLNAITPALVETLPFNGPHILSSSAPCEVGARDFDYGGEGFAFHDVSNRTPNSSYRTNAGDQLSKTVDINSGGGQIEYGAEGEWLVYTLEVQDAGVYAVDVRLSANNASLGGSFYFSMDGLKTERIVTPNQGGWSLWIYVFDTHPEFTQPTYRLSAGKHKFRFTVGPGGFNLMGYKFTYVGA